MKQAAKKKPQPEDHDTRPRPEDPTLAEIAEMCLEIQAGWTDEQRLRRMRYDLRPQLNLIDGRVRDLTAEDVAIHHAENHPQGSRVLSRGSRFRHQ